MNKKAFIKIKALVAKEKYATWIEDAPIGGGWITNLNSVQSQELINQLLEYKQAQFSSGHPSILSRDNISKNKYGAITVKSRIALYAFVPKD